MYSLSRGLEPVCDILKDTRQLETGPACKEACPLDSCDGIEFHPTFNTLCDLRMGPRVAGETCRYYLCGLDFNACPGHPGRIRLAQACFAPHFVDTIKRAVRTLCRWCLRHPAHFAGGCGPCGKGPDAVTWVDGRLLVRGDEMRSLTAVETQDVLRPLGLERLVVTELEVLPPMYRPYATTGARCFPDALTILYANVVTANQAVLDGANILAGIELQAAVNRLFDAKYGGGETATSLTSTIGKKEGRIRQDLMGKRVDESARTVIVGDGSLSICELGVPRFIAGIMGYPMPVMEANLGTCRALVASGEGWARCLVSGHEYVRAALPDGRFASLAMALGPGDTVFRNLRDGDLCVLNRQPTLHRNGFTAHVIRLVDDLAFHLPPNVTEQFNADFDGDEMNMHVPQTLQALAELHVLLAMRDNFIAPNGVPAIGFIQNSVLAAFLVTGQDVLLPRADAMQLLLAMEDPDVHYVGATHYESPPDFNEVRGSVTVRRAVFSGRELPEPAVRFRRDGAWHERWTGTQLVSMLLPRVNVGKVDEAMDSATAVIRGGVLLCGQLSKKDLGAARRGLLHKVFLGFNAQEFMDTMNRFLSAYLAMRGFSVGMADCRVRADEMPTFAHALGPTPEDRMRHLRTLSQVYVESRMPPDNALRLMYASGSKGKPLNATQIVGSVGPQDLNGRNPPLWLGSRCFPSLAPGDPSPLARGYVLSGYLRGLAPTEFAFHCAAARLAMVISKLAPAESGKLQRLMGECLKAYRVDYAGRVVGERDEVIQFVYGGDGLDWTDQPVEPGTNVGMIAAMCTSEQVTQVSLDSFHNVGQSNSTTRIYELFYAQEDKGAVTAEFFHRADALEFARAVSSTPVLADVRWAGPADLASAWAVRWRAVYGMRLLHGERLVAPGEIPAHKAVRLRLSREAFFHADMFAFGEWLDEPAMFSLEEDAELEAVVFVLPARVWELLRRLDPQAGKVRVRVTECTVEAEGLGLERAAQKLRGVARKRLTTTNILDVAKFMGIEAARQSLYDQATGLDSFKGVSTRHIALICDAMCSTGKLQALNFTGMGSRTRSTLGRAVFQSPTPTLVRAAVARKPEDFGNVSACLITGRKVPVGTGSRDFTLIADDGTAARGEKRPPFTPRAWYMPY